MPRYVYDHSRRGRRRGRAGVVDAIGGRDDAYHAEVNAAFRRFAGEETGRFALLEGDGAIDDVHRKVLAAVQPLLESRQ